MSIFGRSARKSVSQVGMQATVAIAEAAESDVQAARGRLGADQLAAENCRML